MTSDPRESASQSAISEGRRLADAGTPVVAVIGWRVPVEVIRAAGMHPLHVPLDLSLPTAEADRFLSPEAKPPLRALLQMVMGGALNFCKLIVFAPPFAPASSQVEELRRMGLLDEDVPPGFYFETMMMRGDAQREFAIARTRALASRVAAMTGRATDEEALERAIADRNSVVEAASQLMALREGADAPAGSAVMAAMQAGNWLSPTAHAELLSQTAKEAPLLSSRPRLLLCSSSVLDTPRVHALAEEIGANIVAEGDIYGSLHASGPIAANTGDATAAIGDFCYANQPLQRTAPLELRRRWYHEQVKRSDIDGVVFYAEDPIWGWDVPEMRAAATAAGKGSVMIMKDVRIADQRAKAASALTEFVQSLARESVA